MTVNYRIGAGGPAPAPADDVGIGLPPLGPGRPELRRCPSRACTARAGPREQAFSRPASRCVGTCPKGSRPSREQTATVSRERACKLVVHNILPPIRGSQPEVYNSELVPPPPHHHHTKVFAGRLNARGTRTRLPRRAGGAWPARRRRVAGAPAARDLGAAATPLARRPLP
jgi:hypothetical protein